MWVSNKGLPLKTWTHNTFVKIASKWGELVELEDSGDDTWSCKRLCLRTRIDEFISERFKVIVLGIFFGFVPKNWKLGFWFFEITSMIRYLLMRNHLVMKWFECVVISNKEMQMTKIISFVHDNDIVHENKNTSFEEQFHSDDYFKIYDILNRKNNKINLSGVDNILDQCGSNEATLNYCYTLLKDLHDVKSVESLDIAQKVKVRWSIEGDENSIYSPGILNKKDPNLQFMGFLLIVSGLLIQVRLSLDQVEELERNVSYDKIKRVVVTPSKYHSGKAFEGNTRDLDSIWEETGQDCNEDDQDLALMWPVVCRRGTRSVVGYLMLKPGVGYSALTKSILYDVSLDAIRQYSSKSGNGLFSSSKSLYMAYALRMIHRLVVCKYAGILELKRRYLKITILNIQYAGISIKEIRAYPVHALTKRPQNHKGKKEYHTPMDDPNFTMEEYIRLEKEKARKHGKVFNWEEGNCVEESIPNALFDDPCHEPLHDVSTSQELSSNVQCSHSSLELIGKWTKDHPLANVIGDPS
ncbi:hypothetical protein Tco_0425736 [Tanacetum coccineum]